MMTIISCITDYHNPWLIALAALVCVSGSWATIRLFKRASDTKWPETGAWFVLTALITGASIWCTHFIAVLGYTPGVEVTFDPVLTIVSLLVAMVGAGIGFVVASAGGRTASLVGGAVVGLAIVVMHYTGMMGYRVQGIVSWDLSYLMASIVISCTLSAAALFAISVSDAKPAVHISTALLVLAIVGLHFTGMTAFRVEPIAIEGSFSNPAALQALAIAVAGVALVIIGAGFASGMIDDRSKANAAEALSNMSNGLVAVSAAGRITLFNDRVLEIFQLAEGDIHLEMSLDAFISKIATQSGWERGRAERAIRNHARWFAKRETTQLEQEFEDGRVVSILCRPLPSGGAILTYEDVTEARAGQRKITHMAYHDALTGLANRRLFSEMVEAASGVRAFSLLMVDLDRFKSVNDKFGHSVGDELLVQVSTRLQAALSEGDRAFRLGGDEFAVLSTCTTARIEETAERIVSSLSLPFAVATQIARIGCSVGVASVLETDDVHTAQRRADLALYKAKNEGRGQVQIYQDGMFEEATERQAFVDDLLIAVEKGQLEVHYQPLYDLAAQRLVGFEALVRWRHPERGMISPAVFIPMAEACGAIDAIGAWVLDEALREASSWPKDLYVSVNVSAVQLRTPAILTNLHRALTDYGLSPRQVEIELTETAMVDHGGQIASVLVGFRALGVRLAMDDFGTGFSSLTHLRDFKIDRIKIDRSFISGARRDDEDVASAAAVVRAVVRMAKELSIETTAEGIETQEQLEELLTLECGTGQGYLLGCPMEAAFARTLACNERNTSAHAYRLTARSGRLPATPQAV